MGTIPSRERKDSPPLGRQTPWAEKSAQERRETLDHIHRRTTEIVERVAQVEAQRRVWFAEGYVKGDLRIGLILEVVPGNSGHPEYLCAVFEKRGGTSGPDGDSEVAATDAESVERFGMSGAHHEQEAMFVRRVETVETPQGRVPSLVWLEVAHRLDGVGMRPLQVPGPAAPELGFAPPDREGCGVSWTPAVRLHQLPGDEVKGRPQVVDGVSHDDAQVAETLRRMGFDSMGYSVGSSRSRVLV